MGNRTVNPVTTALDLLVTIFAVVFFRRSIQMGELVGS